MKSASLSQIKKLLLCASLAAFVFFFGGPKADGQEIVDMTVATVGDGVSSVELITYSDLLWQLALQPGAPLNPPSSEALNQTLQLLIEQRLFALEARRLPRNAPTEAEVTAEIERILALFPSAAEFERRLRMVGFNSIRDDNFRRIIEQRVAIEKYLDFRFRSFVIVTPEEEQRYYRDVYVPEFRRRNPGLIVPQLSDVRVRINTILTEERVETEIEKFLGEARQRAVIQILFKV